jgi:hypothetical protein
MPRTAVPTAPTPVQTAYPVPTGMVRTASASGPRLIAIAATVRTLGQSLVKPCAYFRPMAQPLSKRAAVNR